MADGPRHWDQPSLLTAGDTAGRLAAWDPASWPVAPDWRGRTDRFFASDAGRSLGNAIAQRIHDGAVIYPPRPLRALELTPLHQVKAVILGQDPYHGPGQADGLAFSVAPGVRLPPSLRNIDKEIRRAAASASASSPPRPHGSLESWGRQGVLLLNTCLTVEDGRAGSHSGLGWEALTSDLILAVNEECEGAVFLLWGAHAQQKAGLIDGRRHLVLAANHPSPLSASRPPVPFVGCDHFRLANEYLASRGRDVVNWS